jgi:hypothetical protein
MSSEAKSHLDTSDITFDLIQSDLLMNYMLSSLLCLNSLLMCPVFPLCFLPLCFVLFLLWSFRLLTQQVIKQQLKYYYKQNNILGQYNNFFIHSKYSFNSVVHMFIEQNNCQYDIYTDL